MGNGPDRRAGEDAERETARASPNSERHDSQQRRVSRRSNDERRHRPVVEERLAEIEAHRARPTHSPHCETGLRSRLKRVRVFSMSTGEANGPSCDVMSPGASRASNNAAEDVMRRERLRTAVDGRESAPSSEGSRC